MLTKRTLMQSIDNLPDSFTIDELIDQLIFVEKVEMGIKESEEGKTISNDDVRKMIEKWSALN
ncbi:hypothetical protein [Salibacter sp.]|uniref:hypothetical protein n=1 Tax=Salibacter sp. TaxID=2010995 RepID=UPI0028702E79|nr:hypothetical protein [Salibacter sp.]MDR9397638.1 hypothetical protein [Salibacter sp.]MDR9486792.1 hypothetical protein [Salibacter sp.]